MRPMLPRSVGWFPPQVRAVLLIRDVRVPFDVVEAPRLVSKRLRLKIIFMTLGMATAISLDTHTLHSLCAVMAQRCSTVLS
eukprot:scaffold5561_cov131-Isochrysis_galbana.AAC.1